MMGYRDILLEENPYFYNPTRKRSKKRRKNPMGTITNPKLPANVNKFFQGVSPMDAVCALGGFAGASMIPGLIVKDTATGGKKVGKLLLAFGSTGVVGMAAKSVGGMDGARAAVAGGLAGTLAQAIGMFTTIQIGRPSISAGSHRRIGASTVVSPSYSREGETVSIITP